MRGARNRSERFVFARSESCPRGTEFEVSGKSLDAHRGCGTVEKVKAHQTGLIALHALALGALLLQSGGCSSLRYYGQAVAGQYEILQLQEPIEKILARTNTSPTLRAKLQLVQECCAFAGRVLQLKADGHYTRYADLGRRHVVWNVTAAPEFSFEPRQWWYPVVGRLEYRGFFSESAARHYAAQLARTGEDVYVGGVDAYSTLGWFKDPVLNTFLQQEPFEPFDLADTLFHELAHQRVFASGDTDFNEAFATTVASEGVSRWLARRGDEKLRIKYETSLRREEQFVALVMKAREELKLVYGGEAPASTRHAGKAETVARLRARYEQLKASWNGDPRYDAWFRQPLNNAQLNTVATYYHLVPAFQRLLANYSGDLGKFYSESEGLAKLPKEKRQEQMRKLTR